LTWAGIHRTIGGWNSRSANFIQGNTVLQKMAWSQMEAEELNPLITRRMLNSKAATVARLLLKRGALVPRHTHENEQFTLIMGGALKFTLDDGEVVVRAGEVLFIPSGVAHAAEALEDTDDLDIFTPPRQDWIRKQDFYLRDAAARK
jgi:quercetin dioxygenase-like cupin family protein